ncbi:putative uncharacterized transposon-derived protein F52C9.6 [Nymphon striatum]|nr:putative uncharacterized transposon-derived protein F52C9.6 [Nymphon striatum]
MLDSAFDSVEHQAVLNALNAQNISPAYIRMLDQIFRLGTSNIKLHTNTNKIRLEKGVRQGDSISPKLFTACLENVFRGLNWTSKGIPINGDRLTNLRFADDVVLFSESPQELQLMVEELRTASSKVGLEINLSKTKVMFNRNIEIQPIMTGNVALDQVDRYIYLGQLISIHRDWEPEVRRRVALGWLAFGRLNNVWSSKLPLCLKRKVYDQCVLSVLTYGSDTWAITDTLLKKLASAQHSMERKILDYFYADYCNLYYTSMLQMSHLVTYNTFGMEIESISKGHINMSKYLHKMHQNAGFWVHFKKKIRESMPNFSGFCEFNSRKSLENKEGKIVDYPT